ncbi:aminopeptidase N C-terminal domain-containing protein [Kitasatospora sp. NPDC018058]|uniref:aminopeptidase N C-terminal domain-containing protein n=1 Tax=Kitasatospora sp. NPDC018058 TaxID=3364025 RepID=UPI0037BF349C
MLQLPSYETLFNQLDEIDPVQLADVLRTTRRELANSLYEPLLTCYRRLGDHDYRFNAEQIARRSLRNTCLDYLAALGTDEVRELALRQYRDADNMTDRLAALTALADGPDGRQVMAEFAAEWGEHPLVMDKWFATVARSSTADTLARVRELTGHPAFSWATPNRVAALVLTFCFENPRHFHAADGSGYRFAAEQILRVDEVNPQVSARLAGSLGSWRKVDQARRELMREALQKVAQHSGLSLEASEVVTALRLPE